MRRVEDFPKGIGAVVDHGSPVGFDLRNCLVAQPALQKGGDIVMTQVGCVHGDRGGIFLQVAHDLPALLRRADFRQHQPDLRCPGDLPPGAADVKALLRVP